MVAAAVGATNKTSQECRAGALKKENAKNKKIKAMTTSRPSKNDLHEPD